jgi:hypothetical protein
LGLNRLDKRLWAFRGRFFKKILDLPIMIYTETDNAIHLICGMSGVITQSDIDSAIVIAQLKGIELSVEGMDNPNFTYTPKKSTFAQEINGKWYKEWVKLLIDEYETDGKFCLSEDFLLLKNGFYPKKNTINGRTIWVWAKNETIGIIVKWKETDGFDGNEESAWYRD